MTYRVEVSDRAQKDVEAIAAYIALQSLLYADRWERRIFTEILGITESPHAYSPALEADDLPESGLKQKSVGNYRVTFTVDDERRVISIVHIRHAARRPASPDSL